MIPICPACGDKFPGVPCKKCRFSDGDPTEFRQKLREESVQTRLEDRAKSRTGKYKPQAAPAKRKAKHGRR